MKNQHLPSIIKKITRRSNKIFTSIEIKKTIQSVVLDEYTDKRAYKIIYYLKKKGYLISIKKTLFFVTTPEKELTEELIIEEYYWQLLHNHCIQLN